MKLNEAFSLAAARHAEQRKGGLPFLYHPLAVASSVLKYGGDEAQAIAALLHDAEIDEKEVTERFGTEVTRLVFAFSDPPLPPDADWRRRKEAYLSKLMQLDERAVLVIACEELHELSELVHDLKYHGQKVWDRFPVHGMEITWYFRKLMPVFYAKLKAERYRPLVSEYAALVRPLTEVVFEGSRL